MSLTLRQARIWQACEQNRLSFSSDLLEEPTAALWRGAAGGVNESGDFGGEALPQSGAER